MSYDYESLCRRVAEKLGANARKIPAKGWPDCFDTDEVDYGYPYHLDSDLCVRLMVDHRIFPHEEEHGTPEWCYVYSQFSERIADHPDPYTALRTVVLRAWLELP